MPLSLPAITTAALPRRAATLRKRVLNILALRRSRLALASLTENQLKDIGISAREAGLEAARPLWDAPASWKK